MIESNLIVQGFWHGAPLTTMERLSMESFVQNGHEFHLYVYDGNMKGVPSNVHLRDANEIAPESEVLTFRCAQQFSDFFRIALLLKRGGWHTDLDNVCLRPMDFETDYVLYQDYDESTVSLALAKAPIGSPMLQHCYDYISRMNLEKRLQLGWQEIGTEFVLGAVEYFDLVRFVQPGRVFDPVHYLRVRDLVDPSAEFDFSQSYSLHLFHAAWNDGPNDSTGKGFGVNCQIQGRKLDTDAQYHPDCLYETLKRRFLWKQ